MVELAKKNDKIVAITASMKDGTGLTKFAKEFPDRFFDIGIAEQHALGLAAGMAKEGVIPVVPIYSSFFIYLSSCFVSFCQYSFQFFPAVKNTALYSSQTHAGSFRYLTVFES